MSATPELILIPGPLLGVASVAPLAEALRKQGCVTHVPDPVGHCGGSLPAWRDWPELVDRLSPPPRLEERPQIAVGFCAASKLAAALAALRPLSGVIFLDGDIPEENVKEKPGSPQMRELVSALADTQGRLPPWSAWFADEAMRQMAGISDVCARQATFEVFRAGEPDAQQAWFEDVVEMGAWTHLPVGYLRLTATYDSAADEAEARGWPVVRLSGRHLEPMLGAEEVAAALRRLAEQMC